MNSADTADQMMKMTLEGIEVAAEIAMKAGGATARSLAATLYAILTDKKKIKGKARLDSMLKSGKELKVFAIHHSDLKKFCAVLFFFRIRLACHSFISFSGRSWFICINTRNDKNFICDLFLDFCQAQGVVNNSFFVIC